MQIFLAFPVDDLTSYRLLTTAKNVPDAKWRRAEQLHLTVQYFGDMDAEQVQKLDDKLADFRIDPIAIELSGVGVLGRFGRPFLHAAVRRNPALEELRSKSIRTARRLGVSIQKEKYIPHITLAYLPVLFDEDKTHEWLRYNQDFSAQFACRQLNLYESIQTKHGHAYEVRATYPFDNI